MLRADGGAGLGPSGGRRGAGGGAGGEAAGAGVAAENPGGGGAAARVCLSSAPVHLICDPIRSMLTSSGPSGDAFQLVLVHTQRHTAIRCDAKTDVWYSYITFLLAHHFFFFLKLLLSLIVESYVSICAPFEA